MLVIVAAIALGGASARAETSDVAQTQPSNVSGSSDDAAWKSQMEARMEALEKENAALKQQPGQTPGTAPSAQVVGQASQVTERNDFDDQQQAAPRPNDLTLDPKYRGFVPIPNTPLLMQFNAKPRLDMMSDNRNSGNPDRFVTATIPVEGTPAYGGGEQFNISARGSQLRVDVRAPEMPGNFRFYYQNDFFGSGTGMAYRLQHLYGEFYNVTAGFTYGVFEDPDVWPDTVDYEGPNSMIFSRQPTVRYALQLDEHWELNFGLQQPSSDIDTTGNDATPVNHAPDGGMNVRWEDSKVGHVQLAGILREVGANSVTNGNQSVLGWGLNFSTVLNVFTEDSVQAQITYGQGIFHFSNDNFTYTGFAGGDAAYDNAGNLHALKYVAPMVGYTHRWSDKFRSTMTFGYVNLQNEPAQGPFAYHETYYVSANVIWQIRNQLSVGLEALYGDKIDASGAHGDVWRVQVGMVYWLF
jgi:hypothetical protein